MKDNEANLRPWRLAGGLTALALAGIATISSTSAAFTATEVVSGALSSGRVEISAGGKTSLAFNGANISAIGPGSVLTESITVTNSSTVTLPTAFTDIAVYADSSAAPSDPGGLGGVLLVEITRSIGGGTAETIYSGSFDGLAAGGSFESPLGSLWRSRNGGALDGADARVAVYTIAISLPEDATEGAASQVGTSLVFEARNALE